MVVAQGNSNTKMNLITQVLTNITTKQNYLRLFSSFIMILVRYQTMVITKSREAQIRERALRGNRVVPIFFQDLWRHWGKVYSYLVTQITPEASSVRRPTCFRENRPTPRSTWPQNGVNGRNRNFSSDSNLRDLQ